MGLGEEEQTVNVLFEGILKLADQRVNCLAGEQSPLEKNLFIGGSKLWRRNGPEEEQTFSSGKHINGLNVHTEMAILGLNSPLWAPGMNAY